MTPTSSLCCSASAAGANTNRQTKLHQNAGIGEPPPVDLIRVLFSYPAPSICVNRLQQVRKPTAPQTPHTAAGRSAPSTPPARPYRQHGTLQSVGLEHPTLPFPARVRTRYQVLQRLPLRAAGYQHPTVAVAPYHRMCPQLPNRFKQLRRIQAPIGQPQHPHARRKQGQGHATAAPRSGSTLACPTPQGWRAFCQAH
jgi:hypothetical protein